MYVLVLSWRCVGYSVEACKHLVTIHELLVPAGEHLLWPVGSSSLRGNGPWRPALGARSLSHWTTREGPALFCILTWKLHISKYEKTLGVSVQFSCSFLSDSLRPHVLRHGRLLWGSPTPGDYSNPHPSHQWCLPTISSSIVHFFSHPQSSPASGSFLMSRFFTSGGQSIGVLASASVLPMNIQDWFPLGLTGWISSQSRGLSRVFSSTTVWKHQFFDTQPSLGSNSHFHTWPLEKPWLWLYGVLSTKWCLCFFSMLFRFVIAFLLRNKLLWIPWLLPSSTVILEPRK